MRTRPLPITAAAILFVLLSLMNFPFPWWFLFPGVEDPPAFVIYSGIVVGLVGLVAAVGLWMLRRWGIWLTIVVSVLNLLSAAPGVAFAPNAALQAAAAVGVVVPALIIVLVVLPSSRRAFAAS